MSEFEPSDDLLLSYLLGDLSTQDREGIRLWVEKNPQNQLRIQTLSFLCREIKKAPMTLKKRSMRDLWPLYFLRGGLVFGAFVAGLFIQAYWTPLSLLIEGADDLPLSPISEPLHMESQSMGKFL